jgi:hypothetical protein
MTVNVRRIITGHDSNGKSVVTIDDIASNISRRAPGISSALVWMDDEFPYKVFGAEDMGARNIPRPPPPNGVIFRVVEFEPNAPGDRHVTQTIDFAVVMSGEIDMELDDGVTVHMKAGDTLVQRATVHNWLNRYKEPCVVAFVLIDVAQGKARPEK